MCVFCSWYDRTKIWSIQATLVNSTIPNTFWWVHHLQITVVQQIACNLRISVGILSTEKISNRWGSSWCKRNQGAVVRQQGLIHRPIREKSCFLRCQSKGIQVEKAILGQHFYDCGQLWLFHLWVTEQIYEIAVGKKLTRCDASKPLISAVYVDRNTLTETRLLLFPKTVFVPMRLIFWGMEVLT